MTADLPSGWYLHSDHPGHECFWDGAQWTGHMRPTQSSRVQPAPVAALAPSADGPLNRRFAAVTQPADPERVEILSDALKTSLVGSLPETQSPGWYIDPIQAERARFWNGQEWTGRVRPRSSSVKHGSPPAPRAVMRKLDSANLGKERVLYAGPGSFDGMVPAEQESGWYEDPAAPRSSARFWNGQWTGRTRPQAIRPLETTAAVPAPQVRVTRPFVAGNEVESSTARRQLMIEAASRASRRGWLWLGVAAIGVAITVGTYANATSNRSGGQFVVAWGAIAVGLWNGLRWLVRASRLRSGPLP